MKFPGPKPEQAVPSVPGVPVASSSTPFLTHELRHTVCFASGNKELEVVVLASFGDRELEGVVLVAGAVLAAFGDRELDGIVLRASGPYSPLGFTRVASSSFEVVVDGSVLLRDTAAWVANSSVEAVVDESVLLRAVAASVANSSSPYHGARTIFSTESTGTERQCEQALSISP